MIKMKAIKFLTLAACLSLCNLLYTSCDDTKSYSELLEEESEAVDKFLANYQVIYTIPADNNFEVGPSAPYYQIDDDGNVFMQVIDKGNAGMAYDNEVIYFRYSRLNLLTWASGGDQVPSGNDSSLASPLSFNFKNKTLGSTTQYGTGIQLPLYYLNKNCRVNLLVKSKAGSNDDLVSVTPYLYDIRYFPSNI